MGDKRENIIDALLSKEWKPNLAYLNNEYSEYIWILKKYSDDRGKFYTLHNDGKEYISDSNYLISSDGQYAISVKAKTINLHDANKNYSKILSMNIDDIEVEENGLKSGFIMLLYTK